MEYIESRVCWGVVSYPARLEVDGLGTRYLIHSRVVVPAGVREASAIWEPNASVHIKLSSPDPTGWAVMHVMHVGARR